MPIFYIFVSFVTAYHPAVKTQTHIDGTLESDKYSAFFENLFFQSPIISYNKFKKIIIIKKSTD